MPTSNFQRMMDIINDVFETRSDPDQLQVDQEVIEKLEKIHPSTLSEYNDGNGPAVWVLIIPTSIAVMNDFLAGKINENQILERTLPGEQYEAVYLCSATVLPEFRRKGITTSLTLEAIDAISKAHTITDLYVWPFSEEGKLLAGKIALKAGLPLHIKEH